MIENSQSQYLVWCSLEETNTMLARNLSVFKEISVFRNENWKVCCNDLKSHKIVHMHIPYMTEVQIFQLTLLTRPHQEVYLSR